MRLYLFDDARADDWFPFALSRPICELRFGTLLLRERIERWAGRRAASRTSPQRSSALETSRRSASSRDRRVRRAR